jgi:hypothetical protein
VHDPFATSYDLVVGELQLSYRGSSLVTYPVNPCISTSHYLGNNLCKQVGKYVGTVTGSFVFR